MKIKIRKTDALYSQYIRSKAKWKCERCGRQFEPPTSGLHASHFWGRARENTRFNDNNVSSICFGCHNFFHANPQTHAEWVEKKIGTKAFKQLKLSAHIFKKRNDKQDLIIIRSLLGK